jgi:hypothetical protein
MVFRLMRRYKKTGYYFGPFSKDITLKKVLIYPLKYTLLAADAHYLNVRIEKGTQDEQAADVRLFNLTLARTSTKYTLTIP